MREQGSCVQTSFTSQEYTSSSLHLIFVSHPHSILTSLPDSFSIIASGTKSRQKQIPYPLSYQSVSLLTTMMMHTKIPQTFVCLFFSTDLHFSLSRFIGKIERKAGENPVGAAFNTVVVLCSLRINIDLRYEAKSLLSHAALFALHTNSIRPPKFAQMHLHTLHISSKVLTFFPLLLRESSTGKCTRFTEKMSL